MRFAFAGCDRNIGVFDAFIAAGWEPIEIFSLPYSEPLGNNRALLSIAAERKIPANLTRLDTHSMQRLAQAGCAALIVGSYNFRIPDWRPYLRYAANFHPSPLPYGRGPYPIVNAILHGYQTWAVSCHKIDHHFDTGAILANENVPIDESDTHDSLNIKVQMATARLANRIASNFEESWAAASIQGEGDYWPLFTLEDRTIEFSSPVHKIKRQIRAFLHLGCFCRMGNHVMQIDSGYAWLEPHCHEAGTPVHRSEATIVLACADGYVAFDNWKILQMQEAGVQEATEMS
jgi:methionyl-tRNA formyltransferase